MVSLVLAQQFRTERSVDHIELARWSSGNALLAGGLLAGLAIYAVYWLYRREARGQAGRGLRWSMTTCRTFVLLLLGFIGLEPVIVRYMYRTLDAATIVLVDASASMSIADAYRSPEEARRVAAVEARPAARPSRAGLARAVLEDADRSFLRRLAANNPVRVFTFGEGAEFRASIDRSPTTLPSVDLNPVGPVTDIGAAVRSALDTLGGAPPAAVVLLSDGGFNRGEPADVVARLLRQRGTPLHAVGIGDPDEPVNARLVEMSGPRSAFRNDPFSIRVRFAVTPPASLPVKIELLERDSRGATRLADSKTVTTADDGLASAVFERKVGRAGAVGYTARVPALDSESVLTDNQRDLLPAVQVLDNKMRILLVAGAPSYDYRYLARLLERDAGTDVSCWLQSADLHAVRDGTTVIQSLPSEPKDLHRYDAILLFDPEPAELDAAWCSLVSDFVTDLGGGLLYAAGNKHTGRFLRSPDTAALAAILPIVPDPDAEVLLNDLGQYQTRSWPLLIPESAQADPILRLADSPAENRATWALLDGPYWHYPVLREKPVAQVLLRHSNPRMVNSFGPHILLAHQFAGAGRTAFLGFDSTWRWRRVDENLFNRFWMQAIRHLVEGKLLGGTRRCQIQTEKDQYDLGETVSVTVRALDEKFAPLLQPHLEMTVTTGPADLPADAGPPDRTLPLTPIPGREGWYQGRFPADTLGAMRLSLRLPRRPAEAEPPAVEDRQIAVVQPDVEMRQTAMNRAALRQLAEAAGGKYFHLDEAGRLPDEIPDRSRTIVVRQRPRALWDNAWVFALLAGLLTAEWIMRKKARLL